MFWYEHTLALWAQAFRAGSVRVLTLSSFERGMHDSAALDFKALLRQRCRIQPLTLFHQLGLLFGSPYDAGMPLRVVSNEVFPLCDVFRRCWNISSSCARKMGESFIKKENSASPSGSNPCVPSQRRDVVFFSAATSWFSFFKFFHSKVDDPVLLLVASSLFFAHVAWMAPLEPPATALCPCAIVLNRGNYHVGLFSAQCVIVREQWIQ